MLIPQHGTLCYHQCMNDVQERLTQLRARGWTLASLADELGMSRRGIGGWQSGERSPENVKAVLMALDALLKRKRIPKQRRYGSGGRKRNVGG